MLAIKNAILVMGDQSAKDAWEFFPQIAKEAGIMGLSRLSPPKLTLKSTILFPPY